MLYVFVKLNCQFRINFKPYYTRVPFINSREKISIANTHSARTVKSSRTIIVACDANDPFDPDKLGSIRDGSNLFIISWLNRLNI
jgi:hypothetical protein